MRNLIVALWAGGLASLPIAWGLIWWRYRSDEISRNLQIALANLVACCWNLAALILLLLVGK